VINVEKCTFAVPKVDFLGHRVFASSSPPPKPGGCHPEVSAAVQCEAAARLPRSFQLLQAVRTSCSEDSLAPHQLHRGQPQGNSSNRVFSTNGRCSRCRQDPSGSSSIVSTPTIRLGAGVNGGCFCQPCWCSTAAVVFFIGGVAAAHFFSKKLEPAQIRYSAFDRELFPYVSSIRHSCYMLKGSPFPI
jgi:hypothetical protein